MDKPKPLCKYGNKCYRKNSQHLKEYRHESQAEGPKKGDQKADDDRVTENTGKRGRDCLDECLGKKQETDEPKHKKLFCEHDTQPSTSTAATASVDDTIDETVHGDTHDKLVNKDSAAVEAICESDELLDIRTDIKHKFLVEMPQDFYDFWEFARSINAKNPSEAFASSLGLHLVGPFDILAGRTKNISSDKRPNYLRHWRYYFDPPEFMTLLRGDDSKQFHFGYFRDDPREMPVFVAWNEATSNCNLKASGDNLFAAVSWFIENRMKKDKSTSLSNLLNKLKTFAKSKNHSLEQRTAQMKTRDKKVVSKCFHGAGIVVPVDKNGVGYRELPENPAGLRKILQRIVDSKTTEERDQQFDSLSEIITFVQFANDECDYGEGLELGLDIFCFGSADLHSSVLGLLPLAYKLLHRDEFAQIVEAHLARRTKAPVSALDELA